MICDMNGVSLEGDFAMWVASPCLLGNCSADGFMVSGELKKQSEPKSLLCLFSGRHCASAITDSFWAKYWRLLFPEPEIYLLAVGNELW